MRLELLMLWCNCLWANSKQASVVQLARYLTKYLDSSDLCDTFKATPQAFTRRRILTFPTLVLFLLNQVKGALNDELDSFFKTIRGDSPPARVVSKAAFCKARKNIKPELFVHLNQFVLRFLENRDFMKTWRGRRLFAIDGSTLCLPDKPALRHEFDPRNDGRRPPMARVSHLYDVLNGTTHDFQVMKYSWSEHDGFFKHLARLEVPNSIIVADRGYISFEIAVAILEAGHDFLIRARKDLNIIKAHIESGLRDSYQAWSPTREVAAKCTLENLPAEPIRVRVMTIPNAKGGEPSYMVTSLVDTNDYSYKEFDWLYHQRWFIEEDYKVKKVHLELENFSGHSVEAVMQDIHAKVLTQNIGAVLIACLDKAVEEYSSKTKHVYKVSMKATLSKMKDQLVRILHGPDPREAINRLLDHIFKDLSPFRPGRSFPRKRTKSAPRKPGFHPTYKRAR